MSNEIEICTSCWEEECVCDYEQYTSLDKNIADAIINMNLKGYKTVSSCEGHIELDEGREETHVLDIYFITHERMDNLPEGFKYPRGKNHTDAHRTISYKYINGTLHARINNKYIPYDLEEDKKQHLENLKEWVNELVTIDKKNNPSCYSHYMKYGEPKQPEYSYEVKGWKTYCVEINKTEYEKVEQYILGWQGKIEEIIERADTLKLFYIASQDIFLNDKEEFVRWLKYQTH